MMIRIGLISDTHGLLRAEVYEYLRGSDHIIHAGDIGDASILDSLRHIAPVTVVRGNNDRGPWASQIPEIDIVEFGSISLYVLHDLAELSPDAVSLGVKVVVSGHSHKPLIENKNGVLFVNPGSAGPRRFKLPISAGSLLINGTNVEAQIQHFTVNT